MMKKDITEILNQVERKIKNDESQFGNFTLNNSTLELIDELTNIKLPTNIKKPKSNTISVNSNININININSNSSPIIKNSKVDGIKQSITEQTTNKTSNNPNVIKLDESWKYTNDLSNLNQLICNCVSCELGLSRNKFVFGSGNPKAKIMIIGEAPGADEDNVGLPFVGRAGQLLTKILESIDLSRDEVFIANIIKCRPPNNRRPTSNEVENCEPYLLKQIELINPEFIVALGLTAVDTLLKSKHKMQDVRGKILNYHNRKLMVTYHPAALLRNPNWKHFVWEDVKNLKKMYLEYLETTKV